MEPEIKNELQKEEQKIKQKSENKLSIPMAIIVAGALIAGAVYFSNTKAPKILSPLDNVREITKDDHIRGDLNAPIKIVEYSDTECPFCKRYHLTMKQVMENYGDKVAWVYRHSPIDSIHSKARKEMEATECANELGGNEKFWEYLDKIYEITPANNGLDLTELPKIAESIGLDVASFNACLEEGKYQTKIDADLENAVATGGGGTPWSIMIDEDDNKKEINGALPYEKIKELIDLALK